MATLYLQKSAANAPNASAFSPEVDFDSYEIEHNSLSISLRGRQYSMKQVLCSGDSDKKIKQIISDALEAEGASQDPWMVDLSQYRGLEINRFKGSGGWGFLEKTAQVLSGNFGPISGYMFIMSHNQTEEGIPTSVLFSINDEDQLLPSFLAIFSRLGEALTAQLGVAPETRETSSHILTKFGLARAGSMNSGTSMPDFLK